MEKKIQIILLIGIVILLFIVGVVYVIKTATSDIIVEDVSPLSVKDNLESMDEDTMKEFEKQVDEMSDVVKEMADEMPGTVSLIAGGDFKERAHGVEGKALLIDDNGKKILRFEDFDTINGPALYIYLSSDLGDDDIVDLGPIRATKGNVNYNIPDGVDTSKYNKVLVWCRPFGVLFSYAELK